MTEAFRSFFWETLHIPVLTIQRHIHVFFSKCCPKGKAHESCTVELYFVVNTIAFILALISSIGTSTFCIHYIHMLGDCVDNFVLKLDFLSLRPKSGRGLTCHSSPIGIEPMAPIIVATAVSHSLTLGRQSQTIGYILKSLS
jgi:hypothetical protein